MLKNMLEDSLAIAKDARHAVQDRLRPARRSNLPTKNTLQNARDD